MTQPLTTKTLMIQGCTSDAGKSTVVAGLCRVLARKGIRVAPFKPQNMALNSAVTIDGGEIGRAQAVQAKAAFLEPHTDMNPVLLKPHSDIGAQIIIHGKAVHTMDARDYHQYKTTAMQAVLESYARLQQQYDVIIVEGAGSPAEINLRDRDIANMGFAEAVDCPVILVADIDKGGVFAHLVGTLDLLSESEQQRTRGFIINKFRGDISLLQPGIDWLEQRTGKPVFGTLPYLHNLHLEAEDAINTQQTSQGELNIVVPVFPRISNHTDFDALRLHPNVNLRFIGEGDALPACDLIILPGTKNTRADLDWLRKQGWEDAIKKHLRYGGKLLGICGGMQMLGTAIHDPLGIEGAAGSSTGLGLLDFDTTLNSKKQLHRVNGTLCSDGATIHGYEIHCGTSAGSALNNPFALLNDTNTEAETNTPRADGAVSDDGQIIVTYLHGLFDNSAALSSLLTWAGIKTVESFDYHALQENEINRLADMLEGSLQMDAVLTLVM